MVLYRPIGSAELELIKESRYRCFPPRLSGQPFFYPVLNKKYAEELKNFNRHITGVIEVVSSFP